MDRGSSASHMPGRGVALAEECHSCVLARELAASPIGRSKYVTELVNDDVVVFSGPELTGLVVVPRRCVHGLEDLPLGGRANVLAAIRIATQRVRAMNLGLTSRIMVTNDPSALPGHVSFRVVSDNSADDGPASDTSPQY